MCDSNPAGLLSCKGFFTVQLFKVTGDIGIFLCLVTVTPVNVCGAEEEF